MKRIVLALVAVAVLGGAVAYMAPAAGQADEEAAPIYGIRIPPEYRDWRLISVNHLGLSGRKAPALLVVDPYYDFISEGGKIWPRIKAVAEANNCVPNMPPRMSRSNS